METLVFGFFNIYLSNMIGWYLNMCSSILEMFQIKSFFSNRRYFSLSLSLSVVSRLRLLFLTRHEK